jgi:hypothetical protein
MVLLKTTITGIALVVAGLLLLTVLGPYITVQAQVVQHNPVEPHAQFLVGDVTDRQYTLPSDVTVFGSVDVLQAPTNQSSSIQFIVLDAQNYQQWAAGEQSTFLFTSNQPGQSNFTFSTPASGIYHFVFDNRASLYKKYVTLTVSYDEVSISDQPDPRIPYVSWGLIAVGLIVLVYGLARKPPISWA